MGRGGQKEKAIVRAGKKEATALSEGSREFVSVLETISAARRIIAPFIIYQGKTQRISYYVSGLAPKASDAKTQRQGPHKIVRNPGVQGNSKFKAAASIASTWPGVEACDTTFAVSPSG